MVGPSGKNSLGNERVGCQGRPVRPQTASPQRRHRFEKNRRLFSFLFRRRVSRFLLLRLMGFSFVLFLVHVCFACRCESGRRRKRLRSRLGAPNKGRRWRERSARRSSRSVSQFSRSGALVFHPLSERQSLVCRRVYTCLSFLLFFLRVFFCLWRLFLSPVR